MKNRKTYGLIIACMCLMVAGISLSTSALAQTEPCSVEVIGICNGSTNCSGSLSGGTEIINTGTTAITCQVVVTTGSFTVGEEIVLSPGESYGYGWADVPIGEIPFWDFHPITKSGVTTANCYVTDDTATTCQAYVDWECSATCDLIPVSVDITLKGSTSSISLKDKGLLPVVIMGADDFDTATVDPATIRLGREDVMHMGNMVAPLRWNYKSNDLWLKFDKSAVVSDLMLGDVAGWKVQLIITGRLKNEFGKMPFMGAVSVWVSQ